MLLGVTDMESAGSLDPLLSNSELSLTRSTSHQLHLSSAHLGSGPTSNGTRNHMMDSSPSLTSALSCRTSTTSLETDHGDYSRPWRHRYSDGGRGLVDDGRDYELCEADGQSGLQHGHSSGSVNSDDMCCPANCGACRDLETSLPKSLSLPLRQVTPDPFPELTTSPITPSSAHIHLDTASRSSPSSPMVRRGHHSNKISSLPGSKTGSTDSLERMTTPEHMMWTPSTYTKILLNIYNEDTSWRTLSVDEKTRASDVCRILVLKNHAVQDKNWVIIEHVAKFNLERSLEDHESLYQVHKSWGGCEDNRFYFRKDFRKYEVFKNPNQFFPQAMVDTKVPDDDDSLLGRSERYKNVLLQNLFYSERMPDIQGYMHMKEGKRSWSWKKYFFVLRSSGLYYSTKGNSKDPQHLVLFSPLTDINVYIANNAKKTFGAPKNFCFCLKPMHNVTDAKELKLLCAEDEQARTCWTTGIRLVKNGGQLRENFKAALKYEDKLQSTENKKDSSTQKEAINVKSRVAMDFTGSGGRVVDDPNEALGVAVEEAHQWRKKVTSRLTTNSHSPVSGSPKLAGSFLSENPAVSRSGIASGLHMTQPWFHSGISREEAVNLISKQGPVDGVFLVRESHSLPGAFVLSLAHNHKVKHCQIRQIEKDGHLMFSLDGGHTKFTDLIQLVEFYQLNAGGLPTNLSYYVTRLV